MGCLLAAAANLGLLGAAWVCGRPARSLRDLPMASGEGLAFRLLLGIGFLGFGLFLVGQFYFTTTLGVGVVVAGGSAIMLNGFRADLTAAMRTFGTGWAGWFSLALLGFLFTAGLAEPVGSMGHDGIAYHLLGPKVWLREGRIGAVLDHFHTSFPATVEVLFGVVMAASGPQAAGALGASLAGLLVLQVHGIGNQIGGESAGRLAMATVASIPVITGLAPDAFVDLPFAAFALAAIRIGLVSTRPEHLLLAGCFLGFCAGTKYTGLITIAVTMPILAASLVRPGGRRLTSALIGAGVAASLIACPWYFRNWLLLGTPIYPPPVLGGLFHPRGMPPESIDAFLHYIQEERGIGMGRTLADLGLLPYRLTYYTANFHGAGGIGLLPLGFGWLGLWLARKRPGARLLAAWAGLSTVTWFVTQQEARFLIHAIAVAGVFGAAGASAALRDGSPLLRVATATMVSVSLLYGMANLVIVHADAVRAVLSPTFAAERHDKLVPFSRAFDHLNRAEGVESVLILDSWVPPYYLDRPYVKPIGAYGVFPYEGIRTPRDAAREAHRFGTTHVLDVRVTSDAPGGPRDFAVRPDDGFTLEFASDDARIYSAQSRGGQRPAGQGGSSPRRPAVSAVAHPDR